MPDQQLIQQLMQIFQQGLQVLQNAGGGAADTDMDGDVNDGMDDGDADNMDDDGMDDGSMPPKPPMDKAMAGNDDMMGATNNMGAGTLHDRVSTLERHTGLKKSATNQPMLDRLAQLEEHWLGEEYEGPAIARVEQLEEKIGLQKSAAAAPKAQAEPEDESPDTIPLDALIKSAVDAAVNRAVAETREILNEALNQEEDLPTPASMRKSAKKNGKFGQRKAQATTIGSDADLVKAANGWGYSEDALDQPIDMGDILMAQYHANKNGSSIFIDDED